MNIHKAIFVACSLWAATIPVLLAQTPPATPVPTPPPGPMVAKRAPDFATWTVTTTTKSAPGGPAAAPAPTGDPRKNNPDGQIMQVTKTGDIRLIQMVNSGSGRSQTWCKGTIQVTVRPEWKEPLVSTGENRWDAARVDFETSDFSGFDWLTARNFTGIRQVEGRDCLVFQSKVLPFKIDPNDRPLNPDGTLGKPVDPETLKVPAVAYTDLETRLPVALDVGNEVSVYKFGAPPEAALTLPPNVSSALNGTIEKLQRMLRKPARP